MVGILFHFIELEPETAHTWRRRYFGPKYTLYFHPDPEFWVLSSALKPNVKIKNSLTDNKFRKQNLYFKLQENNGPGRKF